MIFSLILGFIIGATAVIFILQNTAVVALTFLHWQFETSVALVVILSMLVGAVLAFLITLPGAIGTSFRMRKLRKHNELLAKEAMQHKQIADETAARLVAVQTPHPDVIDLKN